MSGLFQSLLTLPESIIITMAMLKNEDGHKIIIDAFKAKYFVLSILIQPLK